MNRSRWLGIVAAVLVDGCDLTEVPDVGLLDEPPDLAPDGGGAAGDDGGAVASSGRCGDSDPGTSVSFAAQVRPLLGRSPGGCTGCHGTSAASGFSVASYEALRRGGQVSNAQIVVPGKPCESVLVIKLSPAPAFGARMPSNGPPFFTPAERTVVADWIAEGAHNN